VGPATAEALHVQGIRADFLPQMATGAALGAELPGDLAGVRVLAPRALEGDEALSKALVERKALVDAVPAYQTVLDGMGVEIMRERLAEGSIDVVTFTSSSTVKNFVSALGDSVLPQDVMTACIGPSTAQTAADLLGRAPDVTAATHTIEGMLAALEAYYAVRPS
jgi:uroporphyrinogen III methyltransferase/synthase